MDTGGAVLLHRHRMERRGRAETAASRMHAEFSALLDDDVGPLGSDRAAPAPRAGWVRPVESSRWRNGSQAVSGLAFLGESAVA